jgi:hypothetical protein
VDDAANAPLSNTVCVLSPACAGSPLAPSYAALGTSCTADDNPPNQECNATGTCVQCNTSSDCLSLNDGGALTCTNNVCQ